MRDYERPVLLAAARSLIAAARSERALLAADAPERQFYLGVEAAAQEVIHPELESSRSSDWLERETHAFREGYLRTSTMVAAALSSEEPPAHLPLPEPGS